MQKTYFWCSTQETKPINPITEDRRWAMQLLRRADREYCIAEKGAQPEVNEKTLFVEQE